MTRNGYKDVMLRLETHKALTLLKIERGKRSYDALITELIKGLKH